LRISDQFNGRDGVARHHRQAGRNQDNSLDARYLFGADFALHEETIEMADAAVAAAQTGGRLRRCER